MIYVDSNVPMYLVGAAHPNKTRTIELVSQLLSARERLVTSAETFQEIIHRYLAIADRQHLDAAYEALEAMVSQTGEVTKADVDVARALSITHQGLSSRDCLHVAVMKRMGCTKLWSFDSGYDRILGLQRIR